MIRNPFKFGREVSGEQFYDREEVFRQLYRGLSGGSSNIVMYAPRRYGKTSLVKKVFSRLADEGMPTLYFDFNKVETIERFCEEYASALADLGGRVSALTGKVMEYLSHLHPTIAFGGEAPFSVKFDYGAKMTAGSVSAVLDLAETVATELGRGSIAVAFDEFQEIGRLSGELPLEGIFRSAIQAHQHVNYIFLGSQTHLLQRMFGDHSRPFYHSARMVRLEKPPEQDSRDFVEKRLASRNIGIDDKLAARIVAEAENIPFYLQQLSYFVFEEVLAAERDWVEAADIDNAISELLSQEENYFAERLSAFSATQRMLISALARESVAEFTEDYRRRHSLGVSATVHAALKVIVEAGVVERDGKTYRIGDPFFSRYVRSSATAIG